MIFNLKNGEETVNNFPGMFFAVRKEKEFVFFEDVMDVRIAENLKKKNEIYFVVVDANNQKEHYSTCV